MTRPTWTMLDSRMHLEHLGYLPSFLNNADPAPARKQLDENYSHGGGWVPFKGFILDAKNALIYPGDPPLTPLAETYLRKEHILYYECSWVVIKQPDGSWEVARMD